jgi:hypothetical protein
LRHLHVVASIATGLLTLAVPARSISTRSQPLEPPEVQPAVVDSTTVDSLNAVVSSILGTSGNLRALIGLPASLESSPAVEPLLTERIAVPGVHSLGLVAPDGDSLVAVFMQAFPRNKRSHLVGYRTGLWPTKGLAARDARYAPPAGFIRVTPENMSTSVSKRFRLGDFLTHDQQNVWPKVLVLRTRLLDKLELIADSLDRRGLPSELHVMSGFRTPQYNARGVGAKGGRARESRHMYGDAADVLVDADGNGRMDDLNGDGRITVRDAKVLFAVAEGVEASHPELVGGLSAYPANAAHGPFVHVDTRGTRARW